jgi:hypothetical protein
MRPDVTGKSPDEGTGGRSLVSFLDLLKNECGSDRISLSQTQERRLIKKGGGGLGVVLDNF